MSVKVKYKGEQILSLNTNTEKALATEGQYCEADIVVENVQDGGITPSGSITLTEERSYDVTDKATAVVDFSATRANLAEAVTAKGVDTLPTSSFDTIATNIGLISGGGGLPTSISKIDGGSFTLLSDTAGSTHIVSHNLGAAPKGYIAWAEQYDWDSPGLQSEFKLGCVFACAGSGSNDGLCAALRNPKGSTSSAAYNALVTDIGSYLTSTTCKLPISAISYKANTTYNWLAWA